MQGHAIRRKHVHDVIAEDHACDREDHAFGKTHAFERPRALTPTGRHKGRSSASYADRYRSIDGLLTTPMRRTSHRRRIRIQCEAEDEDDDDVAAGPRGGSSTRSASSRTGRGCPSGARPPPAGAMTPSCAPWRAPPPVRAFRCLNRSRWAVTMGRMPEPPPTASPARMASSVPR